MKKIIFLVISLLLLYYPAFADDTFYHDSNWGIQPVTNNSQKTKQTSQSEKVWNEEHDKTIDEDYGSEQSPAFLNTENINADEYDDPNYDDNPADNIN